MKLLAKIKTSLVTLLQQRGYYFYKPARIHGTLEFEIGGLSYGVNMPMANYAPWLNDKPFKELYSKIKNNTLVDIYRCYELWMLVDEVFKIGDNLNFIEIGVWRGGTASILSKKIQLLKGQGRLFLADTFTGVVKTGKEDAYYAGGEHADTTKAIVENTLNNLGLNNFEILQGIFPDETAHLVPDHPKFGLCHIDVDVYQSAKGCLQWVWDKLVIGDIVVFDDYGFHTCNGITKFVEEQRLLKDRIVIHNLNGHGILIKLK